MKSEKQLSITIKENNGIIYFYKNYVERSFFMKKNILIVSISALILIIAIFLFVFINFEKGEGGPDTNVSEERENNIGEKHNEQNSTSKEDNDLLKKVETMVSDIEFEVMPESLTKPAGTSGKEEIKTLTNAISMLSVGYFGDEFFDMLSKSHKNKLVESVENITSEKIEEDDEVKEVFRGYYYWFSETLKQQVEENGKITELILENRAKEFDSEHRVTFTLKIVFENKFEQIVLIILNTDEKGKIDDFFIM